MKVKELIEELEKMEPEARVTISVEAQSKYDTTTSAIAERVTVIGCNQFEVKVTN